MVKKQEGGHERQVSSRFEHVANQSAIFLPVLTDFSVKKVTLMVCNVLKLICQKSGQSYVDVSQMSIMSISQMSVSSGGLRLSEGQGLKK